MKVNYEIHSPLFIFADNNLENTLKLVLKQFINVYLFYSII